MKKIIITSGFFNPIHSGHLAYLREAKKLGDFHIVIVNNDGQVKLKASLPFQDELERNDIIGELRCVDKSMISLDKDMTVSESLKAISREFGQDNELVFANGGDRNSGNIPESDLCNELGILLEFGVGGDYKLNSSSTLKSNLVS